jgi:hypothetical protein
VLQSNKELRTACDGGNNGHCGHKFVKDVSKTTNLLLGPRGFVGKIFLETIEEWASSHDKNKRKVLNATVASLTGRGCRFLKRINQYFDKSAVPRYYVVTDATLIRNKTLRALRKAQHKKTPPDQNMAATLGPSTPAVVGQYAATTVAADAAKADAAVDAFTVAAVEPVDAANDLSAASAIVVADAVVSTVSFEDPADVDHAMSTADTLLAFFDPFFLEKHRLQECKEQRELKERLLSSEECNERVLSAEGELKDQEGKVKLFGEQEQLI